MAHTGREGGGSFARGPALLAILGIAAFAGMWSEGFDRLWEAHFLDIGLPAIGGLDPVVWFGDLRRRHDDPGDRRRPAARPRIEAAGQQTMVRVPVLDRTRRCS